MVWWSSASPIWPFDCRHPGFTQDPGKHYPSVNTLLFSNSFRFLNKFQVVNPYLAISWIQRRDLSAATGCVWRTATRSSTRRFAMLTSTVTPGRMRRGIRTWTAEVTTGVSIGIVYLVYKSLTLFSPKKSLKVAQRDYKKTAYEISRIDSKLAQFRWLSICQAGESEIGRKSWMPRPRAFSIYSSIQKQACEADDDFIIKTKKQNLCHIGMSMRSEMR